MIIKIPKVNVLELIIKDGTKFHYCKDIIIILNCEGGSTIKEEDKIYIDLTREDLANLMFDKVTTNDEFTLIVI